ncbi:hypothetical protein KKF91_12525 [Myxococcota bacterium]|nr:hypothetical protein [Myxococcota bacterium]
MGSKGTVKLAIIWAMLDSCLPGHQKEAKTHHWKISFNGTTYPTLPLGPHGKRRSANIEIEIGHVRRMVNFFQIKGCAKQHIPQL